jgi:hypothetical protein
MYKPIFGALLLIAFIWFVRRAIIFFAGRRKIDNATARLESAQAEHTVLDIEDEIRDSRHALDERITDPQLNELEETT